MIPGAWMMAVYIARHENYHVGNDLGKDMTPAGMRQSLDKYQQLRAYLLAESDAANERRPPHS
jgi:hypothetical protein